MSDHTSKKLDEGYRVVRSVMNEAMARKSASPRQYSQQIHDGFLGLLAASHANELALMETIGELADRVKALEAADQYKGTYQRALAYRKGAQVTHGGSLFVALADAEAGKTPGDNPAIWQLAAKGK